MKLSIAFISDHASPLATIGGVDSGGQNVYVAEVARSLADLGYVVDIYTRSEDSTQDQVVDFAPGIRVIHVPAGPQRPVPKEQLYGYMDVFASEMVDFITEHQLSYTLVHAHFWLSAMVAMQLKKDLSLPFVVTFHALGAVRRIHQGNSDKFPKERIAIEKDAMWEAEMIIAECPNDMKDMINLYHAPGEKIEIVPCGYSPKDFYPVKMEEAKDVLGLDKNLRYILQLGRIVPRKGIDNVIEAFASVQQGIPDVRLLIVGGSPEDMQVNSEFDRLKKMCQKFQIENKVIFTGQQPRELLKYYYAASELFITTPWYEPFGITPLESMACGTPVIGADVGGIPFTIRKGVTGELIPPRQPEELANTIVRLITDKYTRKEMSRAAIDHVKTSFTWKSVARHISDLYVDILDRNAQKKSEQQLRDYFLQAAEVFRRSAQRLPATVAVVAEQITKVLSSGGKVLICGNGGSAAEAQHFAAELVGRFEIPERAGYPVMSLNTDTAVLTAWANDFGYESVFKRQVQAFGQSEDMLICLSTSGNSDNILLALEQANQQGMTTVNLLGRDGGLAAKIGDYNIIVPEESTARIQEVHLHLVHQLCGLVENRMQALVPKDRSVKVKKLTA